MLISSVIDNIHLHGFGSSSINSSLESLGFSEKQISKLKKPLGKGGYKSQIKKDQLFEKSFQNSDVFDGSFREKFLDLLNKPWEPNQKEIYELFPERLKPYANIHEFVLCATDPLVADMVRTSGELRNTVMGNREGFLGKVLEVTIASNPDDDREFALRASVELAIAIACAYEHDRNYIAQKDNMMIPIWLRLLNNPKHLRAQYFALLRKGLSSQGDSLQKLLDQETHQDQESARKLITRWSTGKNRPSKALVYRVFETLSLAATDKIEQLKSLNDYKNTYKCILALDYIFSLIPKDPKSINFVRKRYLAVSYALKVEAVTNWGASPVIDLEGVYVVLTASGDGCAKFRGRYLCPCCYLPTLSKRGHNSVCAVCSWEDDRQDSHYTDCLTGSSNGDYSLRDARNHFRKNQTMYSQYDGAFKSASKVKLELIDAFKKVLITASEKHWSEATDLEGQLHIMSRSLVKMDSRITDNRYKAENVD